MYIHIYVYMCICIHICIYAYVYMYIYTYIQSKNIHTFLRTITKIKARHINGRVENNGTALQLNENL